MQALNVLRSHPEHQLNAGMLGAHLHSHHPLLWADSHGRQNPGRRACSQPSTGVSLLDAPHQPGQRGHGGNEQHDDPQGL
jgi:hypothetical protein